jgi:CheY-like chemotaxis protein
MATINLPKVLLSTTILVVDDEPEHIQWLLDFIEGKGMKTQVACSVNDAVAAASENQYRGYIVDLNIPMGAWVPTFQISNGIYEKYKGFYVLKYVRTQGNLGTNVTAYSAHYNEQILAEAKNLYCEYTTKGRVKDFKVEVGKLINTPIPCHGIIRSAQRNGVN